MSFVYVCINVFMQENFNISNGVDGSAVSYSIYYTDSDSGAVCASATILASSCISGVCDHEIIVSSSPCYSSLSIQVTVAATNRFGSGLPSVPVSIGLCHSACMTLPTNIHSNSFISELTTNLFVHFSFDQASKTATCYFPHHQGTSNNKSCTIAYGPLNENCMALKVSQLSMNLSNSVHIGLPINNQFQPQSEFCFTMTAGSGIFTVMVEGTFSIGMHTVYT